ncbi:MAG: hypothetical protein NWF00_07300 [Candidatus Bathyarchaeota archaeon]|nr:hypothetical protein [Candidatus Bathyarchaeota archaeon]
MKQINEKENREVLGRIRLLEHQMTDLSKVTVEIKNTLDKLANERKTDSTSDRNEVRGIPYISDANPWALEASRTINETRKMRNFINSSRVNTYKTTLKALKTKGDWASAEEVGKLTQRKRNTESTYLNRLYRAGLIEQKTAGNKALYKLCDAQTITRLFGEI